MTTIIGNEREGSKQVLMRKIIFVVLVLLCLIPAQYSKLWFGESISTYYTPLALLMGIIVAQTIGHPYLNLNRKATTYLLQASVVGLGFGMNIQTAIQAGKTGILFTVVSIIGTLILGYLVAKLLKVEKKTGFLISAGTAICGGSAIAAISPIIKAEEKQISVALGTIFILNSVALFIFPMIGHHLNLSQSQFGMWCAIAIHDTSSVVGAAKTYGVEALSIATTVKLMRALWIIPVAFGASFLFKNKGSKVKIPWFIAYFILAMVASTYISKIPTIGDYCSIVFRYINTLAKIGLTLTLFLIGCGLNRKMLKSVGVKPLIQGVIIWVVISVTSFLVITHLIV